MFGKEGSADVLSIAGDNSGEEGKEEELSVLKRSVFEDMKHLIIGVEDRKKDWTCGWCHCTFYNPNPTKARRHIAKVYSRSSHVSICRANIPPK